MRIDLNSDIGESYGAWSMGDDTAMLGIITSANVACGFHGGDWNVMHETATVAKSHGVAIGAHPGFNDRDGFGRRVIRGNSMAEIERMVAYQIGALQALATMAGHKVTHVKAHGSLGNLSNEEDDFALALGNAIKAVDRTLVYVSMPGRNTERIADKLGLRQAREFFADRTYDDNGQLTSRKTPGSVIHDPDFAADRVLETLRQRVITTVTGTRLPVEIDTVCVHGDTPTAVSMARAIKSKLQSAGFELKPFVA